MRKIKKSQMQLGELGIDRIELDPKSRDDVPQVLCGLQHLYCTPELRDEVFGILASVVPEKISPDIGRPGMELWKILVLGTLRLSLNWDYDRLHEMVNQHRTIRQMLGHGWTDEQATYALQTLKDNVSLLTPEVLDRINQVVVKAGHHVLGKDEDLRGRCDSFVVETDVHYPTDINLLWDAMRKIITLIGALFSFWGLSDWRQSAYNLRQVNRAFRKAQKTKRSSSKDPDKKAAQAQRVVEAHQAYLELAERFVSKAEASMARLMGEHGVLPIELAEIQRFVNDAHRQIDQIRRRVIEGESIAHEEKVFSLFEGHTEWISKGKAGVPVELGLRVCVMEDPFGFILHHQVMERQSDDHVAVPMVEAARARFTDLRQCSFDKGFHTPANQKALSERLDLAVLPRKGRLSQTAQQIEQAEAFQEARRAHSAVESAINALEVHGLDRCLDHGLDGFKRYVSLAVVGRNIQILGAILRKQEQSSETEPADRLAA
jgi:IS5 family transposase